MDNSECKPLTKCKSLKSICSALHFQSTLSNEDQEENKKLIHHYLTNHCTDLVSDYHHVVSQHLNNQTKQQNDCNFNIINKIIVDKIGQCSFKSCNPLTRNNRNRDTVNNELNERKDTDTDANANNDLHQQFYVDLLDNIHIYFIHSTDMGFRLHLNSQDDTHDDTKTLHVDSTLKKLKELASSHRENVDIRRLNHTQNNKYVTTIEMDSDTKTDADDTHKDTKQRLEYSFGVAFFYWPHYKQLHGIDKLRNPGYRYSDWYVPPKYNDFKAELLNYFAVEEYNAISVKANNFLNTSQTLKQMKASSRLCANYEIKPDTSIQLRHILSILFYTDFSIPGYNMSKTFRYLNKIETDQQLKDRNSAYHYWSKHLRETVEIYGQTVKSATKSQGFFHGVSFMYFNKFVTTFCSPTSMTPQISVALCFCGDGLILELQRCPASRNLKYFDCSYLSCFSNEDERLFIGGDGELQFKSILWIKNNQNMHYYIKAMALFNQIINGIALTAEQRSSITKIDFKIIRLLIEQQEATQVQKENKQFPAYIVECFKLFCADKKQIKVNINALKADYPQIMTHFVFNASTTDNLLSFHKIGNIFKECTTIRSKFTGNITQKYIDGLLEIIGMIQTQQTCSCLQIIEINVAHPNVIDEDGLDFKMPSFASKHWKCEHSSSQLIVSRQSADTQRYFAVNDTTKDSNENKTDSESEYESDECDTGPIIIQHGSEFVRAGFADDDAPRAICPSIVGRLRHTGIMVGMAQKDRYVGDEALSRRGVLSLKYPIDKGVITHWDDMEALWDHIYRYELRISSQEHSVLLTETPLNPENNKEKMTQIMFEKLGVPSICIVVDAYLSLIASGKQTGVVLDSGSRVTSIVPFYEGKMIQSAVLKMHLGGMDITSYAQKILTERGYSFTTTAETAIVRDIKEKLMYIASDFESEMKKASESSDVEKNYELPDGQPITIGSERFRAPEVLFRPSWLGREDDGIHTCLYNSILKCDADVQRDLYQNIVLCGGSTMFKGIEERLRKEMVGLAPQSVGDVHLSASRERKYLAWMGGAVLVSNPTFSQWIKKDAYDEFGPGIIHRYNSQK
eukprot:248585_1